MEAIVKVMVNSGEGKNILCVTLQKVVSIEKSKINSCIIGIHYEMIAQNRINIYCKAELTFDHIDKKYFAEIAMAKFEIPENIYNDYLNSKNIEINGKNYKINEKDAMNIRLCTRYDGYKRYLCTIQSK